MNTHANQLLIPLLGGFFCLLPGCARQNTTTRHSSAADEHPIALDGRPIEPGFCDGKPGVTVVGDVFISGAGSFDLRCIHEVTGSVWVSSVDSGGGLGAKRVDLSELRRTGGELHIDGDQALDTIDLSSLTQTGGELRLRDLNLRSIRFPSLKRVGGTLSITGNNQLTSLGLSALEETGADLELNSNGALTSAELPELDTVGGTVLVAGHQRLMAVGFPQLADIKGSLFVASNDRLGGMKMPRLTGVLDITVRDNAALKSADFGSLTEVTGTVYIMENASLKRLLLPSLETVSGEVLITGNGLCDADAEAALQSLDASQRIVKGNTGLCPQ